MGVSKESIVYQDNALVRAYYNLLPMQHKIVLAAMTQIEDVKGPLDSRKLYSYTVSDFSSAFDLKNNGDLYRRLKQSVLALKHKRVQIIKYVNGHKRVTETGWIQDASYIDTQGVIEFRFTEAIIPYLSNLKEYTRFRLGDFAGLSSQYAIRLLELVLSWGHTGKYIETLDELRQKFCIVDKYPQLHNLRNRVLNPALEQINEKTPYTIKAKEIKSGRRVTGFVFNLKAPEVHRKPTKADIDKALKKDGGKIGESYEAQRVRVLSELMDEYKKNTAMRSEK